MLNPSSIKQHERMYNWAFRLGASPDEAIVFSQLDKEIEIWDYLAALISRSGLLKFQPWIARDVAKFLHSVDIDLGGADDLSTGAGGIASSATYDAIHVRRGDKLITESRGEVIKYWRDQGYCDETQQPLDYIPFSHYLKQGWDVDGSRRNCQQHWYGLKNGSELRKVYVATDDPKGLMEEIAMLPKGSGGSTIVAGCHKLKFIFSPLAKKDTSLYLNFRGDESDCAERYTRNIAGIADLMILINSDVFVGEFNSNWGRLVRLFRTSLLEEEIGGGSGGGWKHFWGMFGNDLATKTGSRGAPSNLRQTQQQHHQQQQTSTSARQDLVFVKDTIVAFGAPHPGWPGF
eukprot:g1859.t1 g1859   contig11:215093-216244(+)